MSDEAPSRLLSLSGLQRICRAYGRVKCGDTMICWDYHNEVALPEKELMADRERWAASERARLAMRTSVSPTSPPAPSDTTRPAPAREPQSRA